MRTTSVFFLLFLASCCTMNAQTSCDASHQECKKHSIEFIPNKNQLHPNVQFEANIGGLDKVFLEENSFTYLVHNDKAVESLHDVIQSQNEEAISNHKIAGHAYQVKFLNAQNASIKGNLEQTHYYNYFLGNEPAKWASKVPVFHQTRYESLYPGIDLMTYSHHGYLKYDFLIAAHTDIKELALLYEGVEDISIDENGDLIIKTAVKEIVEKAPIAYQEYRGERIYIDCKYRLEDKTITFNFPNGYDKNKPLVIDPEVIASTLSGTSGTGNFGHTASYDNAGNIYLGGISFGTGYPTDMGSFQVSYAGGGQDMSVCKFNENGTNMIYATYIGGNDRESPHSIVVDNNQQLCIFGSTESYDFPVTTNAYQKTKGGQEDIAVIKLNQDGSALVGSTFMGGANVDGLNTSDLNTNYGEQFRGEIILDQQGNILIAANTTSTDFPITANAFQSTLTVGGGELSNSQDGVIFKLNSDLSTLFWSTYLGSDDADTAFGIRINDQGEVVVTGTAGSGNFPTTAGTVQSVWPGGEESAYVAVLSSNGQQLLRSTFWGTDKDDHSYFLDIDELGNVHIYGQTRGVMSISPGAYSFNAGSHQYLAAFNSDLQSLIYSTVIGNGPSSGGAWFFEYDFVPAAFMVDKCNGIYFSGYSANEGLQTTSDAFPGSNGDAFYIGVLEPDASDLKFATYFGSANHVDGGTSRFDKGGIVYQAVCSCRPDAILNTNSGSWAEDQSEYCDMGVFKLDFEISTVTAQASFDQSASGCAPYTIDFKYTGQDGATYFWDFDNGNTSVEENPTFTFIDPGSYTVMLVAENLNSCNLRDTSYAQIDILDGTSAIIDTSLCDGSSFIFLDATTQNATYSWQDGSTGATFEAMTTGIYWVDVSISGCSRRDTFNVINNGLAGDFLEDDVSLCAQSDYLIEVNNATANTFLWNDSSSDPSLLVSTNGTYFVTVTDPNGCQVTDSINVNFDVGPDVDLGGDLFICKDQFVSLQSNNTQGEFLWQDSSTDTEFITNTPGVYTLAVTVNGCTGQDDIEIFLAPELVVDLGPDQFLCDQESFMLDGTTSGAIQYTWTGTHIDPVYEITTSGVYELFVEDAYGCLYRDSVELTFGESPHVNLNDATICEGDQIELNAYSEGATYTWNDGSTDETLTVDTSGEFWVEAINEGCVTRDTSEVTVNPIPVLELGDSQVLCEGDFLTLDVTTSGATYEWQDGSSNSTYDVLDPGMYSVVVNLDGCTNTDFIEIEPSVPLNIDLGEDALLCDMTSFVLDVENNLIQNYIWSTGDNTPNISADEDGIYWVEIIDIDNCVHTDSIELTFGESPIINLSDTTLCIDQQIELNAFSQGATYEWSDGSTNEILTVNSSGEFWVEVISEGCASRDTATISYAVAPDYTVDKTEVLCFSECTGKLEFTDNTGSANLNFLWSNGSVDSSISNLCADSYDLIITDPYGCEYVNSYTLSEPEELSFEASLQDVECAGYMNGSISIENVDGGVQPYVYSINGSDFKADADFDNLSGGNYLVEIEDGNGCVSQNYFDIKEPDSFIVNAGPDGNIEIGESFQIIGSVSTNDNILIEWSSQDYLSCDECLDPLASPIETTTYELMATHIISGCKETDQLVINVSRPINIFTPNIFSPNGDSNNDSFTIFSNRAVVKINYLRILDRWGELVFENLDFLTNDMDAGWDGTMQNKDLNPGVFAFIAELELFDGQKEIVKGEVTLVR